MSTQTLTSPGVSVPRAARLHFSGVLRAEWRKFHTVRSTWILSLTAAGILLIFAFGFSLILGATMSKYGAEEVTGGAVAPGMFTNSMATAGLTIAALLFSAAVVVSIAGEFSSHSIISTFSAVPKRWPTYLAKTLVTGVLGFVAGVVGHVVAALLAWAGLSITGMDTELGLGATTHQALVTGLYVLVLTWLGLGLGALMRNTAGAVVSVSIFVYLIGQVLQGLAVGMHRDWLTWLAYHVPTSAVDALRGDGGNAMAVATQTSMATWDAWLTVAFWALVPLALGAVAYQRRDVK